MAEPHREHKGELPLVTASELVEGQYAIIRLQLPLNFDFVQDGGKLLRSIKSAVHLFFRPAEDE